MAIGIQDMQITNSSQKEKKVVFVGLIIRRRGRFKSIELFSKQGNIIYYIAGAEKNSKDRECITR